MEDDYTMGSADGNFYPLVILIVVHVTSMKLIFKEDIFNVSSSSSWYVNVKDTILFVLIKHYLVTPRTKHLTLPDIVVPSLPGKT